MPNPVPCPHIGVRRVSPIGHAPLALPYKARPSPSYEGYECLASAGVSTTPSCNHRMWDVSVPASMTQSTLKFAHAEMQLRAEAAATQVRACHVHHVRQVSAADLLAG